MIARTQGDCPLVLLLLEMMSQEGKHLSELIQERMKRFPVSGEINRQVAQPKEVMQCVEQKYAIGKPIIDRTDGLSMEFDIWRFNLRMIAYFLPGGTF